METQKTSRLDDAARKDEFYPAGVVDELEPIRARARLLELALLGGGCGMSLEKGTYRDALIQGAQDVADDLDRLSKRLGA
jgi:hypothetical protein